MSRPSLHCLGGRGKSHFRRHLIFSGALGCVAIIGAFFPGCGNSARAPQVVPSKTLSYEGLTPPTTMSELLKLVSVIGERGDGPVRPLRRWQYSTTECLSIRGCRWTPVGRDDSVGAMPSTSGSSRPLARRDRLSNGRHSGRALPCRRPKPVDEAHEQIYASLLSPI